MAHKNYIDGRLHKVFEPDQVTETYRIQKFIIIDEQNPMYPNPVLMQVDQERVGILDRHQAGDYIRCFFNVRGREYTKPDGEVVVINNLRCYQIQTPQEVQNNIWPDHKTEQTPPPPPPTTVHHADGVTHADDDMPF